MTRSGACSIFALGLLLAGCASAPPAASPATDAPAAVQPAADTSADVNDPFESMNRQIFEFNQVVDRELILPGAQFYVDVVPEGARTGLHNFLQNLDLPVVFANDVLQGEMTLAGQTAGRFGVNSTYGLAGIIDQATPMGLPYHDADFGQTLGVYGVGEGPYLVVPVFGPDPPRDILGQVADVFLDPVTYIGLRDEIYWSLGRGAAEAMDARSRNIGTIKDIESSSVDFYASVRSLYRQHRQSQIRHGKTDITTLPNM
jgi:phospholipid-binding lipoprotein MlaA